MAELERRGWYDGDKDPNAPRPPHQGLGLGLRSVRGTAALILYFDTSALVKLVMNEDGSHWRGSRTRTSVASGVMFR